jgi:hypothetical protein
MGRCRQFGLPVVPYLMPESVAGDWHAVFKAEARQDLAAARQRDTALVRRYLLGGSTS